MRPTRLVRLVNNQNSLNVGWTQNRNLMQKVMFFLQAVSLYICSNLNFHKTKNKSMCMFLKRRITCFLNCFYYEHRFGAINFETVIGLMRKNITITHHSFLSGGVENLRRQVFVTQVVRFFKLNQVNIFELICFVN